MCAARHSSDNQRMKAEIIAVGSELLTPDRLDTNSLFLTEELNTIGIEVLRKTVVGDNRDLLAEAFRDALHRRAFPQPGSRNARSKCAAGHGAGRSGNSREPARDGAGSVAGRLRPCDCAAARPSARIEATVSRASFAAPGAARLRNSHA